MRSLAVIVFVVIASPCLARAQALRAEPNRGITFELSGGGVTMIGSNDGAFANGIAGPNFAVGNFIRNDLALSIRMPGVIGLHNETAYLGILGPDVQYWPTPSMFLGLGAGVAIGCDGCGGYMSSLQWGLDARAGVTFLRTPNRTGTLSLQVLSVNDNEGPPSLTSLSFLIGVQTF